MTPIIALSFAAFVVVGVLLFALFVLKKQNKHIESANSAINEQNKCIKSTNEAINELVEGIVKLEKATDLVGITGVKEGFPRYIEAAWEDIGARGRFLTDLGGMSVKMREQLRQEMTKVFYTPLTSTPPAGSPADIMLDIDRELTRLEKTKDDVLVLVKTKPGVTQ